MNRQEKESLINFLKESFNNNQSSFLIGMKGMSVNSLQGLRSSLRANNARLKVAKNTLLKKAVEDISGADGLIDYFSDQIAVVFVEKEPSSIAKILSEVEKKEADKVSVIVGLLDKKIIGKDKIKFLASLPSKEVLQAQLCGVLKQPIANNVRVLSQVIQKMLVVLKQVSERDTTE